MISVCISVYMLERVYMCAREKDREEEKRRGEKGDVLFTDACLLFHRTPFCPIKFTYTYYILYLQ